MKSVASAVILGMMCAIVAGLTSFAIRYGWLLANAYFA